MNTQIVDSQTYAGQKTEIIAKALNQSKVFLASRLPKYNLAQQKQRSNLCITTQNGRNTTKYQIFLRQLIRKYSRKGKKWQPRLICQMNAVFNTCFPLHIDDLEIIDLRGLLPLRREKGTEARIEKQNYIIGQPCYMIWCYQSLRGSYLP